MKKIATLIFSCFIVLFSQAQWSNTSNQFYDSLHMPVTTATGDQQHAIVVKSYPDSGYFVIWEDYRTTANKADLYAQKYDKDGIAQWASGGVAVIAGPDNQLVAPSSNADYRYAGHACTDSAGGFYAVWDDANETVSGSTARHRVGAQHVLQNGAAQFAYPGFVVAQAGSGAQYQYAYPQLIADGRKGCFISYLRIGDYGDRDLYAYDYVDEGGTMVNHGGSQADVNVINQLSNTACGVNSKNDVVYLEARVLDYNIYPDLQGGCNIVFSFDINSGGNARTRIGFNQLCRVKKESQVTVRRRTNDIAASNISSYTLKKDSVIMLYTEKQFYYTTTCKVLDGNGNEEIIVYTNFKVENFGNGFLNISDTTYGLEFAKGTVATTDGSSDINANIMAVSQRDYNYGNNSTGNWYKRMFIRPQEVYDSIPFQLSTDTVNPYFAYKLFPDKPLDKINDGDDTLLTGGVYDDEFALASSNNRIFAAGRVSTGNSAYPWLVNLSQLQVARISSDSFAVQYHTPEGGATIGKEASTGFSGTDISYDHPLLTTDERGNALFSITDKNSQIHVSPIADSARLIWGAMGKIIGSGVFNNSYYNSYSPYAAISPADGTAVIAWTDSRYISSNTTGLNIYMRHLDSLNFYNYLPPQRGASFLSLYGVYAFPNSLTGLSYTWSYFEGYNNNTGIVSTMAAIFDNYNLGGVTVSALDNPDADGNSIRRYDNVPYLDRNFTINVENNPNGAASIDVQLYFTTDQFKALQKADPTITSPADLIVIKQPKGTTANPTEYTPIAGEQLIVPTAWKAVDGGYYVQLPVSSFSYFFIEKNQGILPVKWVNVSAERKTGNTATVSWTVANEINVKNYLVQYSEDGVHYKDGFVVSANGLGTYHSAITIGNSQYFVKIKETDLDGRSSYSNTVIIASLKDGSLFIVSPNPVRSDATLRYTVPATAKAFLRLVAASGAVVWQQSTTLSLSGTVSIPMKGLSAGIYQLQISTGKEMQMLKIIKE